jgi:hypothetical protein
MDETLNKSTAWHGIPTITNGNTGISIYEKCGSSNLTKFFTEDYSVGYDSAHPNQSIGLPGLTKSDLKKFQNIKLGQFTNSNISTLIIVTRNEKDRWCAGVTQDMDEQADLCEMTVGEIVDEVQSAFDNTPDYINRFMRGHSHLGNKMWYNNVITLIENKIVHFIDIKDLSDRRFWDWVCATDPEWPDVKCWWNKWISEYGEYDIMHKNRLVTEWIRFLLDKHEDLKIIKNLLTTNQQVINEIKDTAKWLNFGQKQIDKLLRKSK